jgi:hypothetical protein
MRLNLILLWAAFFFTVQLVTLVFAWLKRSVLLGGVLLWSLLFGLPLTALARFLFGVGQHNRWTSDGPGILFVMMAFAFSALFASP